MTTMREMIDASNGLTDWNLTIEPSLDDGFTARVMSQIGQRGEFKPSEISREIFGDIHNSHILAVGQRLRMLAESGQIRHVRACIYTTEVA